MGELRVEASSPRQRLLEAFRLRSEHASAITEQMRAQMATRLIDEYGSAEATADSIWALARENSWYREGEGAERYLLARPNAAKIAGNKAALDFLVTWHGTALGHLTHDGFEWRWRPANRSGPPLIRETAPGKCLPSLKHCCRRAGAPRFCINAMSAMYCDPASATCRTSRDSGAPWRRGTGPGSAHIGRQNSGENHRTGHRPNRDGSLRDP
jgi:hypothetical protein